MKQSMKPTMNQAPMKMPMKMTPKTAMKLSPTMAAKIRANVGKMAVMLALIGMVLPAHAAVTTIQVTLGAGATVVSSTPLQCTWIIVQNNSTHAMRIGDSTVTASKGILLASGSPGGSFYQGPKPTGGATNLGSWYVFGTANDVVDVTCDVVTFN